MRVWIIEALFFTGIFLMSLAVFGELISRQARLKKTPDFQMAVKHLVSSFVSQNAEELIRISRRMAVFELMRFFRDFTIEHIELPRYVTLALWWTPDLNKVLVEATNSVGGGNRLSSAFISRADKAILKSYIYTRLIMYVAAGFCVISIGVGCLILSI